MHFILIARHAGEPGSGGSRRPISMCRALERLGHSVCLISPFDVPDVKESLYLPLHTSDRLPPQHSSQSEEIIPVQIEREEKPASGLKGLPKHIVPPAIMRQARLWSEFPDIDRHWGQKVLAYVQKNPTKADWVITSSPPESLHGIGAAIADLCRAKWLAELRDSWVEDSHRSHVRGMRAAAERWTAQRWLRRTDAVSTVNDRIAAELRRLTEAPVLTVPHFSEPFSSSADVRSLAADHFNLVHAGGFSLSDRRRDLPALVEELDVISSQRVAEGRLPICLHIIGRLAATETAFIQACLAGERGGISIESHGPVTLEKSRDIQHNGDGLLLYSPSDSRALPGKYSEYALCGRPIFFKGPEIVRALVNTAELLQPLARLASAETGQCGPIDTFYEADVVVRQFVEDLQGLE